MATIAERDFTLGGAAELLGLSKATIRSAIVRGALEGTKLPDGSYKIHGAELEQYRQNRSANDSKMVSAGQVLTVEVTPPNAQEKPSEMDGVQHSGSEQVPRFMHDSVVNHLETTIKKQDTQIERLHSDVEREREERLNATKLLTDQSRAGGRKSRWWIIPMGIVLGCAGIWLSASLGVEWGWPEMPIQWE